MRLLSILLFVAVAGSTGTWAEIPLPEQPGYIDFADLGLIDEAEAETSVEIYLKDPLLSLVAAATRLEDEELANMLAVLDLIQVRAYDDLGPSYETIAARLRTCTVPGWEQVVRVREQDQQVQVYIRVDDKNIAGLLVLACEESEFVLINIVGPIDLAQVGRIGRKFDLDPLDALDEIDFEADAH